MENSRFEELIEDLCARARAAAPTLAAASGAEKDRALCAVAEALRLRREEILEANREDMDAGEKNGLRPGMLDRLRLTEERIEAIAKSVEDVAALPSPVGAGECFTRPNGLVIRHIRVPLGVVAMIYEARPNVTVDAAALCLKTGNSVILRGGKEALCSNRAEVAVIRDAISSCGLPADSVTLVEVTDREAADVLMTRRGKIDLLLPRGGAGLIRRVVENATVPVIETGAGNCHLYVDESAELGMSLSVAMNAKTSRPSVCNAIETLLVHKNAAGAFLPMLKEAADACGLELRGCERTGAIIDVIPATEEDYATEYDDMILAVRVVDGLEDAISHIKRYSTGHSEAIMTESRSAADRFVSAIDSAALYVNASTRFTDGGEFGLGAEIGISTQKLHARGPMGLSVLTTDKYIIEGNGQIR